LTSTLAAQLTAGDLAGLEIRKGHQRLILAGIAREQGTSASPAAADDAAEIVKASSVPESKATAATLSPALFDGMSSPVDAVCATFEALVSELRANLSQNGDAVGALDRLKAAEEQVTTTLFGKLHSQDLDDDDCSELMELAQALSHRDFDTAIETFKQLNEREEPGDDVERGLWIAGISTMVDLLPATLCSAAEEQQSPPEDETAADEAAESQGEGELGEGDKDASAEPDTEPSEAAASCAANELSEARERIEEMTFDGGDDDIDF